MNRHRFSPFYVLLSLLVLQGCASSSIFKAYPAQAAKWQTALAQGSATETISGLEGRLDSKDRRLYLQERARIAQLAGDIDTSMNDFKALFAVYDEEDSEARIRVSGLGTGGASMLTNDNAIPYRGYDYERIFAHTFQALNYLEQKDLTGVGVELRRANLEQQVALERRAKEIAKAEEEADNENVDTESFSGYFEGMNAAASKVKSSVQNAYTFYLSATFWEATGQFNDALIDYKKALEINPELAFIKKDVERVSAKMDGRLIRGTANLVILYEDGFVPPKREISLPIPTIHGVFSVAFPVYESDDLPPVYPLIVNVDGEPAGRTQVIARMGSMAVKAHKERIPGLLVRQTLRAATKYKAQKEANENNFALGLATQLYNLVSERADLRSWLTLPAYTQVMRTQLTPGSHTVNFSSPTGTNNQIQIEIPEGGTTLIRVTRTGNRLITKALPVRGS